MTRLLGLGAPAICFALMGIVALIRPRAVVSIFGGIAETPASRSEIRAVYGGFGLAVAALLAWAARNPGAIADGVVGTIAISLLGMAAGRVVGLGIERGRGLGPTLPFVIVEIVLAASLGAALNESP